MKALKFNVNDFVTYCGTDEKFFDQSGDVVFTVNHRMVERNSKGIQILYPKDAFDYSIRFSRKDIFLNLVDVKENEIC